jgi:hypothetical protein
MMTEATDQTAAIHRYEDALASLLVHQRIGQQFDFDLQTQFHEISIDVEPYRDTPEYSGCGSPRRSPGHTSSPSAESLQILNGFHLARRMG